MVCLSLFLNQKPHHSHLIFKQKSIQKHRYGGTPRYLYYKDKIITKMLHEIIINIRIYIFFAKQTSVLKFLFRSKYKTFLAYESSKKLVADIVQFTSQFLIISFIVYHSHLRNSVQTLKFSGPSTTLSCTHHCLDSINSSDQVFLFKKLLFAG